MLTYWLRIDLTRSGGHGNVSLAPTNYISSLAHEMLGKLGMLVASCRVDLEPLATLVTLQASSCVENSNMDNSTCEAMVARCLLVPVHL